MVLILSHSALVVSSFSLKTIFNEAVDCLMLTTLDSVSGVGRINPWSAAKDVSSSRMFSSCPTFRSNA